MLLKMKKNRNKIKSSLVTFILVVFLTSFTFVSVTANSDDQMAQLEDILNSSSNYSAFQINMLLNSAQDLIEEGISYEDTEEIIKNSIDNSFSAYNIKKVFDIIIETQQEGLLTESLINKVNEGLAKNIDNNTIINVVYANAENLKKAKDILSEAQQEGLEVTDSEEIVEVLANSLENGVPRESLSWLANTVSAEGGSIEQIAEISEEFSYFSIMASDLGLSFEEVSLIFEEAIDNNSNIDNICENIQNSIEAEMNSTVAQLEEGREGKTSAISSSETPSDSSEEDPLNVGESSSPEAGEAPSDVGNEPEPPDSPGEDSPSPPSEN